MIGRPLWLVVGESNWVRTTLVTRIRVDPRDHNVIDVHTEDARYRFVFASPPAAAMSA